MRKSGTFALVAGVLGFVVDAIALATFIAQARPEADSFAGIVPRILSIILLVYGWFVVSWVIAKRKLAASPTTADEETTIISFSVAVIGLLLLPIAMMIGYDIFKEARGAAAIGLVDFAENVIFGSLISMAAVGTVIFLAISMSTILTGDE